LIDSSDQRTEQLIIEKWKIIYKGTPLLLNSFGGVLVKQKVSPRSCWFTAIRVRFLAPRVHIATPIKVFDPDKVQILSAANQPLLMQKKNPRFLMTFL